MRTEPGVLFPALFGTALFISCAPPALRAQSQSLSQYAGLPVTVPVNAVDAPELRPLLSAPLDEEAAIRIALLNNPDARAWVHEAGIARGELWQARLLPNPELEVEGAPAAGHDPAELEVTVEYEVTHALLTPLRAAVAERRLEASKLQAAGALVQLVYDVRAALYAAAAAQQRLELANRWLDGLAAARDTAVALHAAGNTTALAEATQVAAFESARATAADAELDVQRTRERLNRLLGLHGSATRWTLARPAPGPKAIELPGDLEARALAASLELQAMQSGLEALGKSSQLQHWSGVLPDVALGVRSEREEHGFRVGGVLAFTLPIFDRQQGAVAATAAAFDAQKARLEAAAVDLRASARDLRNELEVAERLVRHFAERLLPARREVLRQTLLQYNAMQVGIFQLVAARQALLDAELAQANAQRDLRTLHAALDALLAGRRVSAQRTSAASPPTSNTDAGGH